MVHLEVNCEALYKTLQGQEVMFLSNTFAPNQAVTVIPKGMCSIVFCEAFLTVLSEILLTPIWAEIWSSTCVNMF